MSAQHIPGISLSELLELKAAAEHKSEYWDGQVFAMAGGTYDHALLDRIFSWRRQRVDW